MARKLTDAEVIAIRKRCAQFESITSIAKDFKIGTSAVSKIRLYKRHKDVLAFQPCN